MIVIHITAGEGILLGFFGFFVFFFAILGLTYLLAGDGK